MSEQGKNWRETGTDQEIRETAKSIKLPPYIEKQLTQEYGPDDAQLIRDNIFLWWDGKFSTMTRREISELFREVVHLCHEWTETCAF